MITALKSFYQRLAARRVFTRWAETYEEDVAHNRYSAAQAVAQAILPYLHADSRIIDLGIGSGLIWQTLDIEDGMSIVGLDISSAMLEQASSLPVGPLYCCDVGRDFWPADDNTQDMVISAGLFEYLTEPMARHVMAESARVLKPGGLFIATYIPGEKNHNALWAGKSGSILRCIFDPHWMENQPGFFLQRHSEPFAGSVYEDSSSYDYRLIILKKAA